MRQEVGVGLAHLDRRLAGIAQGHGRDDPIARQLLQEHIAMTQAQMQQKAIAQQQAMMAPPPGEQPGSAPPGR